MHGARSGPGSRDAPRSQDAPISQSQSAAATTTPDASSILSLVEDGLVVEFIEAAMTLIDEEDAVLLYRCNPLAESSPPLLVEAVSMRRTTLEDALTERVVVLWREMRPRLEEAIHQHGARRARGTERNVRAVLGEQLDATRLASDVRAQQLVIEKDAAVRAALRLQEEGITRTLAEERERIENAAVEHRKSVERDASAMTARAQAEASDAIARARERESRVAALEARLDAAEEEAQRVTKELAKAIRQGREVERLNEAAETKLAVAEERVSVLEAEKEHEVAITAEAYGEVARLRQSMSESESGERQLVLEDTVAQLREQLAAALAKGVKGGGAREEGDTEVDGGGGSMAVAHVAPNGVGNDQSHCPRDLPRASRPRSAKRGGRK
jgi:hypothetical protein